MNTSSKNDCVQRLGPLYLRKMRMPMIYDVRTYWNDVLGRGSTRWRHERATCSAMPARKSGPTKWSVSTLWKTTNQKLNKTLAKSWRQWRSLSQRSLFLTNFQANTSALNRCWSRQSIVPGLNSSETELECQTTTITTTISCCPFDLIAVLWDAAGVHKPIDRGTKQH